MDTVWNVLLLTAGGVVGAGVAVEAYALHTRKSGDTLSEHMRPWAKRHPGLFIAVCGLLTGVGAWLPGHILN